MTNVPDEVAAIQCIGDALETMSQPAVRRILAWANDRFVSHDALPGQTHMQVARSLPAGLAEQAFVWAMDNEATPAEMRAWARAQSGEG